MEKVLKCKKSLTLDFIDKEFEFFVDLSLYLGISVDDFLSGVISNFYNDCLKCGSVKAFYTLQERRIRDAQNKESQDKRSE